MKLKITIFFWICSVFQLSYADSKKDYFQCIGTWLLAPNHIVANQFADLIFFENMVKVMSADFTDEYSIDKVKDNLIFFSHTNHLDGIIKNAVYDNKSSSLSLIYLNKNSTVFYIETFNGKCINMN